MIKNFNELMEAVRNMPKKTIAVAAAEDPEVIALAEEAGKMGLADFILIGSKAEIEKIAESSGKVFESEIIDELDNAKAARLAVSLVKEGKANTLMKGLIHTSTFIKAVLDKENGLNKGKLISQISVLEKENNEGLQLITDCVITIQPDISQKIQIINNAVELLNKLGYEQPRVALLSALETVNPAISDTVDAAVISKMADRGQIRGAIIDGPFALDNAVSPEAARHKKIISPVAGCADILLVPNMQTGNIMHKTLTFYAHKTVAAAIVGAGVPIVMNSRTDPFESKLVTIALACYIS